MESLLDIFYVEYDGDIVFFSFSVKLLYFF